MDINDEDDDLDEVIDSEEDGSSRLDDLQDKVENAKNKIDNAKDIAEKIKNNSSKSGSPEGPSTKPNKQNENKGQSGGQSQSGKAENSTGNTGASNQTSGGKTTGANSTGSGANTSGASGAGSSTTGAGTGAGTSGTAGASSAGGTATAEGAAAGSTTAGSAAAGSAAAGGATAGGTAAGGAAAAATPVGWVILIVIAIILLLLMIAGFLSFFIDGIGLISEKFLKLADGFWTSILSNIEGADKATVKNENIVDIGTYLENMGYNLEGFGFIDSNGKSVTTEDTFNDDGTGTRKVKNSDGKVILERAITKSEGGEITEGEITKMESEAIWSYLVAENRTYLIDNKSLSIVGFWEYWFNDDKITPGSGMIAIVDEGPIGNLYYDNDVFGKVKNVSINREKKEMIIELDNYKYSYSLDGWTGKYGKSLEFLLTLHLATMSPDFAKEVALNEAFNAKVFIGLRETEATITLLNEEGKVITESNYEELGFTDEEWAAIESYNKTEDDPIKTYTPYIRAVQNHWYYELIDFSDAYEEIDNDSYPNDNSDKKFTYEYEYVGLGGDNDILSGKNLIVREIRESDIYQVSEPRVTKREYSSSNLSLQTMLLGGNPGSENTNTNYQYYIYDGSSLQEGAEREKRYIMQKLKSGENTEYVMDTRFFQYAFAILESVHTQDSEYILRDLKELFYNLGVDIQGEEKDEKIGELNWLIPDYIPVNWDPMFNTTETELRINAKTETNNGFEEDLDVIIPADGKVTKISDDDDGTQTIKIEFVGTDDSKLKGKTMYIRGIKSRVNVNQVCKRGNTIGKTYTKDITIIMTNKNHSPIANVDEYLKLPENA